MSFIRPEVATVVSRWRETIIGLATAALGAYWSLTSYGALQIIGTTMAFGGALLAFAGVQRARFRRTSLGKGLVRVLEGQLTYFGPEDGGAVFINDISILELWSVSDNAPAWVIHHAGGAPLEIPIDATGAEALFDVFSALPGLNTPDLLANLQTPPQGRTEIWRRAAPRLH